MALFDAALVLGGASLFLGYARVVSKTSPLVLLGCVALLANAVVATSALVSQLVTTPRAAQLVGHGVLWLVVLTGPACALFQTPTPLRDLQASYGTGANFYLQLGTTALPPHLAYQILGGMGFACFMDAPGKDGQPATQGGVDLATILQMGMARLLEKKSNCVQLDALLDARTEWQSGLVARAVMLIIEIATCWALVMLLDERSRGAPSVKELDEHVILQAQHIKKKYFNGALLSRRHLMPHCSLCSFFLLFFPPRSSRVCGRARRGVSCHASVYFPGPNGKTWLGGRVNLTSDHLLRPGGYFRHGRACWGHHGGQLLGHTPIPHSQFIPRFRNQPCQLVMGD